jgi:hypothetical protein
MKLSGNAADSPNALTVLLISHQPDMVNIQPSTTSVSNDGL